MYERHHSLSYDFLLEKSESPSDEWPNFLKDGNDINGLDSTYHINSVILNLSKQEGYQQIMLRNIIFWSNMQGIFRRESSENNVPNQAVHFNPETSEVVLPEPNIKQKLSRQTRLVLFIRDSKWGGVPFAVLYGLYMYYMVTFLILSDPAHINSANQTNR